MVSFITSWVQGIIIAVIISTIIEMILPDGNIKKYVRTVIGTFIVFVIISPIITKITGKEISLNSYEMPEIEQYKEIKIDTNSYIESTYIKNIEQDIIENIEGKGYEVQEISIDIDKTEESYGAIHRINLYIAKGKTNDVEPIEININSEPKQDESITEEETKEIKDFLKENYVAEAITINGM